MATTDVSQQRIAALTPLKILIVAETEETLTSEPGRSYVLAIQRAFQGGVTDSPDGSEKYYSVGDELGVEVHTVTWSKFKDRLKKEPFKLRPHRLHHMTEIHRLMKSCGHLYVICLLDDATSLCEDCQAWLDDVASLALQKQYNGRIGILPIALDTESEGVRLGMLSEFQRLPISELGEYALRAGHLGLLVLQRAWSLLGDDPDGRMRLFISHAKLDGAPIALSLKSQIESLRWLQRFYDACDILPGTQWQRVLREGVQRSVVVVLRTDIYEQRPWCVQEINWAEEFGCPAVVVDLRAATTMPREVLPVAGMVTVRICDGNLIRILNAALREAMRVRLFRRTVELLQLNGVSTGSTILTVPRPSLSTLGIVCESFLKQEDDDTVREAERLKVQWIVTPEPFRESLRHSAVKLVKAYFPNAKLGIPRDCIDE